MTTFIRPTLTEIKNRVQSDINSRLPNSDSRLSGSVLNVLAFMLSGLAYDLYGFITWISLQAFPDTAEIEFLNRWGAIWGVDRKPAAFATGIVTVTGVNGKVIPEGTILQRSDGVQFATRTIGTISSLTLELVVDAVVAGDSGNTDGGVELIFVSPIDGVQSIAVVDGIDIITGGVEIESDASYLARILERIQEPPAGGATSDYEKWMLAISGVTRVWVYPLEQGIGTVTVRFMMDDLYTDGIPHAGDVSACQTAIDLLKPATAEVYILAPVSVPLDFTIQLVDADTSLIRASVEQNLKDLILRDSEPAGTIRLSRINEAISLAEGEIDHILTDPATDVTVTTGQISTMGTITWV